MQTTYYIVRMNVKKDPFTHTAIILQQFFIEKLLSGRNSIQEIDIRKQRYQWSTILTKLDGLPELMIYGYVVSF